MPFFTGASNFSMNNVEMNDVQGNYTRNETKNVTNNSDMNNHYSGSTVSKNNTETMNNTIGNGHGNTISFGTGRTAFNGTVEGLTPDLSNLLQTALSSLPGGMPNISGMTMHTSTMTQKAPQQKAPPVEVSNALAFMAGISADAWTPEMISALKAAAESIQSMMAKKA